MTKGEWIVLFDIYMLVFWSVAYIECIRIGFRDKTYCVPLFAIGLNFTWELSTMIMFVVNGITNIFSYVLLSTWLILDCGIIYTYMKFGENEIENLPLRKSLKKIKVGTGKLHYIRALFLLPVWGGLIVFCVNCYDNWLDYFPYVDNLIMSILFLLMLHVRKSLRGQSISIAICKCAGSLFAIIACSLEHSVWLLCVLILCNIVDFVYVSMVIRAMQSEKTVVLSPKNKKKQNPS